MRKDVLRVTVWAVNENGKSVLYESIGGEFYMTKDFPLDPDLDPAVTISEAMHEAGANLQKFRLSEIKLMKAGE